VPIQGLLRQYAPHAPKETVGGAFFFLPEINAREATDAEVEVAELAAVTSSSVVRQYLYFYTSTVPINQVI
jgi:hypothetical protein